MRDVTTDETSENTGSHRDDSAINGRTAVEALSKELPDVDALLGVLVILLRRVGRVNDMFARLFTDIDDTSATILASLLLGGSPYRLSPTALSQELPLTAAGVTKSLRRLESAGLVRRCPEKGDGRMLSVQLTPAGKRSARRDLRDRLDRYDEVFAPFGAAERHMIVTVLRRLLDVLEDATRHSRTTDWLTA